MNKTTLPSVRSILVIAISVYTFSMNAAREGFCQDGQSQPQTEAVDDQDWARDYLKDNPLESKPVEELTLKDLEDAFQDPQQQSVVMRQFHRANLTAAEASSFLQQVMQSPSVKLQMEATRELLQRGELQTFIRERIGELNADPNDEVVDAARLAVDMEGQQQIDPDELPDLLSELSDQLHSNGDLVRLSAESKFRQLGLYGIPTLLKLLKDEDPRVRKSAALLLAEVVMTETAPERSRDLAAGAEMMPPPKSGPDGAQGPVSVRVPSDEPLQTVRVFFGTNRKIVDESSRSPWMFWGLPSLFLLFLFFFVRLFRQSEKETEKHHGCRSFVVGLILLGCMLGTAAYWNGLIQKQWSLHEGVRFGPVRDLPDVIHYGDCIVSLPPSHVSGDLERPWLGPENEKVHVVLRRTSVVEKGEFYQSVKQELKKLPSSSRDCFIFVHGFNVSFEDAAMRTAQIAFDLKVSGEFEGIPMFYSWPSAGSPILYSWDRAEIRNSKTYLKQFLQDAAANIDADKIHVVAHSMGADLVAQAISDIDTDEKLFHQIVLAAPDIDRDVFRRDIAPKLAKKSVRTTMYCSRNDFALQISYQVNHARRIGDTSDGVFVMKGVDTIDASEMPTDLLGHSYYGDCVPLAADIALLMKRNASPNSEERHLQPRPWQELFYWVFGESSDAQ